MDLPKVATIEQACNWLRAQSGTDWTLARLLESGLMPWFWLDYTPGYAALFGNRLEGYLAPMVFAGDSQRLEADGGQALVNMTRTHDGDIAQVAPGIRVPLSDLRFQRDDLRALSDATAPAQAAATPVPVVAERVSGNNEQWKEKAQESAREIIKRDKVKSLYPSQKNIADEIAKEFRRDGVMGAGGKPLSGASIKRHALKGITSEQGRELSTAKSRGK